MPDIFDEVSAAPATDVFDELQTESKPISSALQSAYETSAAGFEPGPIEAESRKKGGFGFGESQLPPITPFKGETLPGQALAAAGNFGYGLARSAATPAGEALGLVLPFAPPLIQGAAGLGFGLPLTKKGIERVYKGAALGEPQESMEGALDTLAGGTMAAGGVKQASEVTAASFTNPKTGETTTAPSHVEASAEQGVEAPKEPEARETPAFGYEVQDPKTGATAIVSRQQGDEVASKAGQLKQDPETGVAHSNEIEMAEPVGEPSKAADKVEAEVTKIANTEGQRPAKEIKSELVTRLEKSLQDAPDINIKDFDSEQREKIGKVTIDIPDDGTFTVWNTKAQLQFVLDRAKRIKTDTGKPPGVRRAAVKFSDTAISRTHTEKPEMVGMGGALYEGEFKEPRQATAAGSKIEQAPPEDKPLGMVSGLGLALNKAHDAIKSIGTTLKGIAGESMPKTTAANREVGEAGVRYASSRIAAKPLADTFTARVLQDTDVDPVKFGAALTEDNLRSIRESLKQKAVELQTEGKIEESEQATAQADNVATIIGSKGSPFKTEDEYFDFLNQPETQKAVGQHVQLWQEVIEPQYKEAMSLDPDMELSSRGLQTGARVNLKAVLPEEPSSKPVKGVGGASLTATFKKKSPFGVTAKGTGQTYDVDYQNLIRNTFERQLEIANKNAFDNALVASGNAVIDKPGQTVTLKDGESTSAFPISRKVIVARGKETTTFSQAKNIYVRRSLADEYRTAANVDARHKVPIVTATMNVLNRAALAGLTDATVHLSNQATALFNRPVSGKLLSDTLLSATGRADVPVTLVKSIVKAFQDNQKQLSELAEIGALRPDDIHFGVFGKALKFTDRITRLMLDDTMKNLSESGLVDKTETARREYVNQIGQYNRRLQGWITRQARDTGLGPFVTAGKTFNALGVRMMTLDPGVQGSSAFASAALRANVLSKWVGAAVLIGTLNYLLTHNKGGGMLGRKGTPIGNLDLGTNDKSGKQQSLPLLSILGLGRGMRVTGVKGALDAKRMGLSNADALESASRDIINSWSAPFAGPPVKAATIAATGFPPAVDVGRASPVVPPGENQRLENAKEAVRQASPLFQTYIKYKQGKPLSDILSTQIPRLAPYAGKTEALAKDYPRIVKAAQANEFINWVVHETRRKPAEERVQFAREQIVRLPPEFRQRAADELEHRKVFAR